MNDTKELKNKLKIISDPYARTIEYYYLEAEKNEWFVPAETSDFKSPPFTNAAIYHKAYDILDTALKCYGGNVGVEIFFEGTADDFGYLNNIADKYFQDKKIKIVWGGAFLPAVKEVKRDIESKFKDMDDMFEKYPSNAASEKIKKFIDTMSNTIPICVMGLYSTGKSAFINSLLGVEILPSADDPTTAKTFKISVGPKTTKYSISFEYQDERTPRSTIKLEFQNSYFKISRPKTSENDIITKLDEIKAYKSEYDRMYHALSYINEFDRNFKPSEGSKIKWRVSPLVEISLPLKKSYTSLPVDQYDFVIYDTPGSNSASNVDHKQVLKKAMKEQTNGLPIYVTTSKNMDSDSHPQLIETLNELGNSLDRNNLMIIVNQADDADKTALENKKNNFDSLYVHRLNPAGTYFVSSIMGLGSKMMQTDRKTKTEIEDEDTGEMKTIEVPCFIYSHYQEIFRKNKRDFVSKNNPKSLYSYNIVPIPEYDKYKSSVKLDDIYDRIFSNSGLDAVGFAISEFADSYSFYNKCRNAAAYLTEAFNLLTQEIDKIEQEQERLNDKLHHNLGDKERALDGELEKAIYDKKIEYQKSLTKVIQNTYENNFKSFNKDKIIAWAESTRKKIKGLHRKVQFTNATKELLEEKLSNQWNMFRELAANQWELQKNNLKETLIQVIVASPILTDEQKYILKSKIEDVDVPINFDWYISIKSDEIISQRLWMLFVKKDIANKILTVFNDNSLDSARSIHEKWRTAFDNMGNKLENEARSVLCEHNPEMLKIQAEINKCIEEIGNLREQKNQVSDKITEIINLTEFKANSEEEV